MKCFIGAFLFVACVAPVIFAVEMPGTARFAAASQAMANSPTVPPKVRPIFKRFIAAIDATKPCVAKGDYECIIRNSQEVGLGGMEEGAKLSQGPLKQLFEKLIKTDEMALAAANNFSKNDVQLLDRDPNGAADIVCNTLTKLNDSIVAVL